MSSITKEEQKLSASAKEIPRLDLMPPHQIYHYQWVTPKDLQAYTPQRKGQESHLSPHSLWNEFPEMGPVG